MRRIIALTAAATALAVLSPLAAHHTGNLEDMMKQIGAAMGKLKKDLDAKMPHDAASDGEKLESLFKDVEEFWAERKIKNAVQFSRASQAAAKGLIQAGHAENLDAASAAFGKLGETCKACHEAHREKLPNGGFKIKP